MRAKHGKDGWDHRREQVERIERREARHDAVAEIAVLIPGPMSPERGALASCAIEGNQFAIDALETIRRVEAGEAVGAKYVKRLNRFMEASDGREPKRKGDV